MEWLNIKDSASLVSKSESTIKRSIKSFGISNGQPGNDQLLYKTESASHGYTWYIEKTSLLNFFKINKSNDESLKDQRSTDDNSKDQLIELLKDQVREKDKTIKELLERIREMNILLKQSQDIKLLPHNSMIDKLFGFIGLNK